MVDYRLLQMQILIWSFQMLEQMHFCVAGLNVKTHNLSFLTMNFMIQITMDMKQRLDSDTESDLSYQGC